MEVTYELHAFANDRWSIIQKYPAGEQERALEHAKQLYREPHVVNVKVVKESYDPATNQSADIVIFDTSKTVEPRPAAPRTQASRSAPRPAAGDGRSQPQRSVRPPAPRTLSFTWVIVLIIVAIAAGGILMVLLDVIDRSLTRM